MLIVVLILRGWQILFIYYFLFGCPTANFGSLLRGQPDSHDFSITFLTKGQRDPRFKGSLTRTYMLLGSAEYLVGVWTGNICICSQCIHPLGQLPKRPLSLKTQSSMLTRVNSKLKLKYYFLCTINIKKTCVLK